MGGNGVVEELLTVLINEINFFIVVIADKFNSFLQCDIVHVQHLLAPIPLIFELCENVVQPCFNSFVAVALK